MTRDGAWRCHRRLAEYRGGEDPADPGEVLAMQLVLRIEKNQPPDRRALLTAAAQATALLCLDDRADDGGAWAPAVDAWCDARIRKIARRARGSHWEGAGGVDGLTVTVGGAQARALVPGPVGGVDRRISRLQIGGTDLPGELPATPCAAPDLSAGLLRLWLNPELEMTVGKQAAQLGHGVMLGIPLFDEDAARHWRDGGAPVEVLAADPARWEQLTAAVRSGGAAAVRDAGFTEIAPGSVTVIAEATTEAP